MKIIRFLNQNKEAFGRLHDDNRVTLLDGDITSGFSDTGTLVTVEKLLAPILPSDILCVGLNYKQHAAETGAKHLSIRRSEGGGSRKGCCWGGLTPPSATATLEG